MSTSTLFRHPLADHAYTGEAHGIRFTCSPASYAAGKMTLRLERLTDSDGMKSAADRLAEALNGHWSNRCHGYHLAPSRAALWRAGSVLIWICDFSRSAKLARDLNGKEGAR